MRKNIKRLASLLIIAVMVLNLFGCSKSENADGKINDNAKQAEAEQPKNEDKKSDNEKVTVKYSNKFNVEYLDNGVKLVTDGEDRKLLLVPRDAKKPEGYDNIPVINIPIENVLLCSSIHPSLLRPLNVFDKISCVTTYDVGKGHIEEIDASMKDGAIKYVGKNDALDFELIKAIKPQVAFVIEKDIKTNGAKFDELGIPYVVEASSLENHPLGRMEWTSFMSIFFDKEAEANAHLNKAEENINRVSMKVAGKDKPVVTAGVPNDGKFSVRAGGSYQAKMYSLAGGEYAFADVDMEKGGVISMTFEDFYAKSTNADIYVYEPMGKKRPKAIAEVVQEASVIGNLKSVESGEFYSSQPWWFQSVDKLDEIVEDLAAIFHPEEFQGYELRHYYKVSK